MPALVRRLLRPTIDSAASVWAVRSRQFAPVLTLRGTVRGGQGAARGRQIEPFHGHPPVASPVHISSSGMASILIIDDEPELRDVFASILEKAGHEVLLASGARDGLAAFSRHRPDVVITDVILPDESG